MARATEAASSLQAAEVAGRLDRNVRLGGEPLLIDDNSTPAGFESVREQAAVFGLM